jgi:hypothetical protein
MTRSLMIAVVAALLAVNPAAAAEEHSRKKSHAAKKDKDKKVETGASCKAPAVGSCASCAITCRPLETAQCAPGQVTADMCTRQPACGCK